MKENLIKVVKALIIIALTLFLVILIAYDLLEGPKKSSAQINKILSGKDEIIKIGIDKNAQYTYHMSLKMSGKINGKANLSFGGNENLYYNTNTISNDFLIEYDGDWYSDSCIIKFKPITATNGILKVECDIFSARKSTIRAVLKQIGILN